MGSYWFMLIFCISVVLLAIIVIPWIIIYLIVESIQERKKKKTIEKGKKSLSFEDMKAAAKFTGAVLAFALAAVFLGFESVPYIKDFPHVIKGTYKLEENFIEYVVDGGKDPENKIRIGGEDYYSTKIKRKHEGKYIIFEYLPNTKIIISFEIRD